MAVMSFEEEPIVASSSSSPTTACCFGARGCRGTVKEEEQRKKKCELIGYDELPEWLKDNEFIHGYYRCEWPMKETLLSIFAVHNETLNVWSHLLGFALFLCLTILSNGDPEGRQRGRSGSGGHAQRDVSGAQARRARSVSSDASIRCCCCNCLFLV